LKITELTAKPASEIELLPIGAVESRQLASSRAVREARLKGLLPR